MTGIIATGAGLNAMGSSAAMGAAKGTNYNQNSNETDIFGKSEAQKIGRPDSTQVEKRKPLAHVFANAISNMKSIADPTSAPVAMGKLAMALGSKPAVSATGGGPLRGDDDDEKEREERKKKEEQLKKDQQKFEENDPKTKRMKNAKKGQESYGKELDVKDSDIQSVSDKARSAKAVEGQKRWGKSVEVDKSQTPKANAREASRSKTGKTQPVEYQENPDVRGLSREDLGNRAQRNNTMRYEAEMKQVNKMRSGVQDWFQKRLGRQISSNELDELMKIVNHLE